MGLFSRKTLVPVLYDSIHGLTLYEAVPEEDSALAIRNWMPNITREDGLEPLNSELRYEQRGAIAGSVLGVLAFVGGIALLAFTFDMAIQLYLTDPAKLFGLKQGKALDLSQAGVILMGVIVKILLLLVMAIVGGVVTNRGKALYVDSRHASKALVIKTEPEKRKEKTG